MANPVAGAAGAAALRKEAEVALRLEREGCHGEALARVDELAAKHTGSALVLHLAGLVHHAAARRAVAARDKEARVHHFTTAQDYLTEAKRLVPNCIDISVLLARVLFEDFKHDEAENEARRAIGIPFPVDPAENNVVYSVDSRGSPTRDQRIENCRESARNCFRVIADWICKNPVPRAVREVLELERQGTAKALKMANDLAKRYTYSSRAQLIRAYMKLKFARGLDAAMDRRPFLARILVDMNEWANEFDVSLVLAMFRAKLCFVLGLYEAAYLECRRAYAIQEPVDPKLEDVPPGSVNGEEYDDRLSSVYRELERLLRRLLWVAKGYWCSMTSEKQDGFLSVKLIELHKYYDEIYENDYWAARTISDALRFVKKNRSWRFWICPFCVGKKLRDTDSLLQHMCNKHPAEKLWSVLDPKPSDDYSLDEITVCQDSENHYFFHFKKTDYIFEHLFLPPSSGIEAKSFAEIREEKCKKGIEILEKMKQKLENLLTDKLSAEFDKARPEIQELWHGFLAISALDYREVILTLAKSFLWAKLIKSMSEDNAASKSIDNADIDGIFPNVVDPPASSGNKDHKSGDDRQTQNMKPSHSNQSLKIDGNHQESEVDAEDKSSGTMADTKLADSPVNMAETGTERGSSSQSSEETSMSILRKGLEVLCQDTKDICFLNFIIQTLWNLRRLRDEFLKRRPVCSQPSHKGPCIADILYNVFSALEKNDHHITSYSLISLRDIICQILNDSNVFKNVERNISSDIVATILNGLHMRGSFHQCSIVGQISSDGGNIGELLRQAVDPSKVILNEQMNCGCRSCFGEKEYTTSGEKHDSDSLQTGKVKSFAEDKCRHSSLKNVHLVSSNAAEFSIIVLHWPSQWENNKAPLCELIDTSGEFRCKFPHSTTEYTLKSTLLAMICYEEELVGIARDQNKWLIYNDNTVVEVDSWEDLLNRYGKYEIRPQVAFLEVIK